MDFAPRYLGAAPFSWTGMYLGAQLGGAWGQADISDPYGPSIFGDKMRTPGAFAGGAVGYNWQSGSIVYGLEADANWADLDGSNTCFAFSGFFISANCRSHTNAFGALTARLGVAVGPQGRTLLYIKGGGAWEDISLTATTQSAVGGLPLPITGFSGTRWGWTAGAGAEYAMRGSWSVKAEYDYLAFADSSFVAPTGLQQVVPGVNGYVFTPGRATSASQDIQTFKVGLNYKFGGPSAPLDEGWSGGSIKDAPLRTVPGTEFEFGARYVSGWGRFQKDLGVQGLGINNLASRLTYDGMRTDGGEVFARLDTRNNLMLKGFIGAGSGGGHMNDEDWVLSGATVPYSNTLSSVDNRIRYGTIDAGYDVLRGPGYKLAPFIGYNVLSQNMKAVGCTQIANPFSDCVPPLPTSVLGITEDDKWQSLRIGLSAQFMLMPRVQVTADAAYLPYVWFDGTDNHVLRALVSPEDGHGNGVQLELALSYAVTDQFSLGVGGRYWSMHTTTGETNFGGTGGIVPQKFAVEQAALMLQGSYKFSLGDSCCAGPLK